MNRLDVLDLSIRYEHDESNEQPLRQLLLVQSRVGAILFQDARGVRFLFSPFVSMEFQSIAIPLLRYLRL